MIRRCAFALILAIALPGQNTSMRAIPPAGVAVSARDRAELDAGLLRLKSSIQKLRGNPLLPDVRVYYEAVRAASEYGEFFKADEIGKAKELLRVGQTRADQLAQGQAPWTTATGLVVRGYVSKIDKSVQPYGLVVPASYSPTAPHRWRLDAWFHGRNETLSEVNFITDRQKNPGEFTPANTIVLHLYGRYCNANKFAGEIDLFEALEDVKRHYAIDENRILVRGFSMGGAATWHIAAHHAGLWAAAAPGAGFAETAEFLKMKPEDIAATPEWERSLWHSYDVTGYAANFFNLPIVAYNGEIDPQKQAADVMERAMAEEGLRLKRVIGPGTAHKYHPDSKTQINAIIDPIAERGRDPSPRKVRFTTWTLAYNRMKWVVVDGLAKHWERARLDAEITGASMVEVHSSNVTAFSFEMGAGGCALDPARKPSVVIDGQKVIAPGPMSDRSWSAHFRKTGLKWAAVESAEASGLHKKHGLQGPVDDAFMDSFVFVRPTGEPAAPGVTAWVKSEMNRAAVEWRKQFRGDVQMRDDTAVSDSDIAESNLILWGDPGSNAVLRRIMDKLPIQWTEEAVTVGANRFAAATHAPILIYPNPLNPRKYVVLNSGVSFREFDYLSNARQVPKLPDYAVVDTSVPPNERYPGKVVLGGFFSEDWTLATRR